MTVGENDGASGEAAMGAVRRIPGDGWLVLLGGGEFSFGDTLEADRAWLAKAPPGPIGFIPAASGSPDYADEFAGYLDEAFDREVRTVPIYRVRDARRGKNLERLEEVAAVYLGAGVVDQLLEALVDTPAIEALAGRLARGGVIAAIGAAAQALGVATHPLGGRGELPGLSWLPGGVVETGFDPGHDRRLRRLLGQPGVTWGLGLPPGSAVLLGPGGTTEVVGTVFPLDDPDADLVPVGSAPLPSP